MESSEENKQREIRQVVISGEVNDYVFKIPESLHLIIPKDLVTKDRNMMMYIFLKLLGYECTSEERKISNGERL